MISFDEYLNESTKLSGTTMFTLKAHIKDMPRSSQNNTSVYTATIGEDDYEVNVDTVSGLKTTETHASLSKKTTINMTSKNNITVR